MTPGAERLKLWREKPQAMVRELFGATPDLWQDEVLAAFPTSPQIAMKACKGPGKTALISWLAWNFLLTRPHPNIAATAISGENLRDNMWKEMAVWQNKSEVLKSEFEWTAERIFHKEHKATWWMSARRWAKSADQSQQANTLAGLHSPYVMAVLDESGGIPESVMVAAEAIHSSATESHILQAGNPTHLEGPLYMACTRDRAQWLVVDITGDPDDPKRSSRVSIEWAREQIRKYGRDNPWVLVNVFGQFPPASINALIGPDEVRAAMGKHLREDQYNWAPMILGVDVARFGDDESVIYPRQGPAVLKPRVFRGLNSTQGAAHVNQMWREQDADGCFLDGSGGWATGWHDQLETMGRAPISVDFSGKATNGKYFNKRTEMLFETCEAIKSGGWVLPDDPELVGDLCAHTYTFQGDKLRVVEKDEVKALLGRSPNHSDALALTTAYPMERAPRGLYRTTAVIGRAVTDYNPMERP